MATNEYGLDTRYMTENLERILKGIDRYRPDEMERALVRLANVARPSSRSPGCSTADELLEQIRHDLLWRAEEEDSDGCKVVDLSCGLWMKLNRYLDRRR